METITLRPTGVLKYEDCPRAYKFQYVLDIQSDAISHSLAFGKAGHKSVLPHVAAHADGQSADTVALFADAWQEQLDTNIIRFSSKSASQLKAVGTKLAQQFPEAWRKTGLVAVKGSAGPLVENRLKVHLGGGVWLSGEPDIVAAFANDPEGDLVVPDVKFAAAAAFDGFAIASDQLTGYQTLVHFHKDRLGLAGREIGKVGFLEGLKKVGAEWAAEQLAPARTEQQMGEYLSKVHMTAALIRKGYFPKRSASGFNSPCSMCDFAGLCLRNCADGLVSRRGSVADLAEIPSSAAAKRSVTAPTSVAA